MELYRLKMGRPKKTDKAKKPSQVEGAGRTEDTGVTDPAVERNVILTDGNNLDGQRPDEDTLDNAEAGGLGLQGQRRRRSDTDKSVTDSSVERAKKNLQKTKRSRLVSTPSDEDDDEGDNDRGKSSSEDRKRKKGKASAAKRDSRRKSKERREREKRREQEAEEEEDRNLRRKFVIA